MEMWRDIRGYEGLYQVSNYGRVRSLDRYVKGKSNSLRLLKGRIIRQIQHGDYLHVLLYRNGVGKWLEVHQLVAQTFIPNPHDYDVVHHKDHDPSNNRVENLEWMPNNEHAAMHAAIRAKERGWGTTVYQYTLDGELVAIFPSTSEAAKQFGFDKNEISICCRGGRHRNKKWIARKTHKGFKWSYNMFN